MGERMGFGGRCAALAFLAISAAIPPLAEAAPAKPAGGDFAAEADRYIRERADAGTFSGSVLIAYDGRALLRRAYGPANRELNVPARPESEYALASMSKTFTAVAVLQLVQAGRIGLDDPIAKFIPDAPATWREITIARLLSHESGLPEYSATTNSFRALMRIERTPAEILKLIRDRPLKFPPGSRYDYNNSDFVALGLAVEAASGEPFEAYVTDHLLTPLHLDHTGFEHAQALLPGRASGYMRDDHGVWTRAFYIDPSMLFGAGAMYSDVDDLLAWDRAIHGDRLLTPALRDRMFTDRGHGYGLGFFVDAVGGKTYVGHGGSIPGFATDFERFRDKPLTLILLSNSYLAPVEKMSRELSVLYDRVCPRPQADAACRGHGEPRGRGRRPSSAK